MEGSEKFPLALPPYLAETDKRELLKQLGNYPSSSSFFGAVEDPELLQGDAWRGLVAIDFGTGERESVVGLVISNSCDLGATNNPDPWQNVLFAPLVSLAEYENLLRDLGKDNGYIGQKLDQIRNQEVKGIFYLPANGTVVAESLVLLDDIRAQPLATLHADEKLERLFSLSSYGWYVLLFKLSVFFTRMTEGVKRTAL